MGRVERDGMQDRAGPWHARCRLCPQIEPAAVPPSVTQHSTPPHALSVMAPPWEPSTNISPAPYPPNRSPAPVPPSPKRPELHEIDPSIVPPHAGASAGAPPTTDSTTFLKSILHIS